MICSLRSCISNSLSLEVTKILFSFNCFNFFGFHLYLFHPLRTLSLFSSDKDLYCCWWWIFLQKSNSLPPFLPLSWNLAVSHAMFQYMHRSPSKLYSYSYSCSTLGIYASTRAQELFSVLLYSHSRGLASI